MNKTQRLRHLAPLVSLLVLLLLCLTGCDLISGMLEEKRGSLLLEFTDEEARGIPVFTPDISMEIDSYEISGTGPDAGVIHAAGITGEYHVVQELAVGLWQFTISGHNAEGQKVAEATLPVTIRRNQTTEEEVTLKPLEGQGKILLDLSWIDDHDLITNPQVAVSIQPSDLQVSPEGLVITGSQDDRIQQQIEVDAGWYLLTAAIFDGDPAESGNTALWQGICSVRIVKDHETELSHQVSEDEIRMQGTGTASVLISEDMQNQFEVTYSGDAEDLYPDESATFRVSSSHCAQAEYRWYVNGRYQPDEHGTELCYQFLTPGHYRISLFVIENGAICGYDTSVEVLTPIPVTGIVIEEGSTLSMTAGIREELHAVLTPSDATNRGITWSSSAPEIIAVSDAGALTSMRAGTAVITAASAGDPGISASCTVTSAFSAIGDYGPAGGRVFYVDTEDAYPGWTYMTVAPMTEAKELPWGADDLDMTETYTAIGAGKGNTDRILLYLGNSTYMNSAISSYSTYAAKYCAAFSMNGYDDWFLPSQDELGLLSLQWYPLQLGGYGNGGGSPAWSSSSYDGDNAHMTYIMGGSQSTWGKWGTALAVPVRRY